MSIRKIGKIPNVARNNKRVMSVLHKEIGGLAIEHYLKGFTRGGGQTNDSLAGWKKRKKETSRTRGRALLVESGDYRRALSVLLSNKAFIKLGTRGIKYASFHNEGANKLPKREVLGDSRVLEFQIKRLVKKEAIKQNKL